MRFLTSWAELRTQATIFLVYLLCVGLYGAWREETPGDAERFASQDLCAQIGWTPRQQASPVHVTDVVLLADGADDDGDVAAALLAARALEREGGGSSGGASVLPVSARVVTPKAGAFRIPSSAYPSEEESAEGEGGSPSGRRRFFVFAPVSEVPKYPLFWALRACVPPAGGVGDAAAAAVAGLVVPTTAESYLNDFGCKERAVRGPDVLGGGAWGRRSTPLFNAHPLADTVAVDDVFVALRCGGRVSAACYAAARRAVAGAPTLVLAGLRLQGYAAASEGLLGPSTKGGVERGEVVVAPVVERAVHRLEVYSDEEYHTQMAIVLRDQAAVPHVSSGASLPQVDVVGLVECLREACVSPDFARLADRRTVSVPAWIRAAGEGSGGGGGGGGGGGAYAWPRDYGPGAALRTSYNTSHPQSALLRRVLYTQAHTHPLPAALGSPVVARNRCAAAARHIKQGRKASAKSFPLPVSEREMRRLLGSGGGGGGGGGGRRLVVPVREKGPPLLRRLGGGGGGGGGSEFGTSVPFGGSAADAAAAAAAAARSRGVGSAAWYAGVVLLAAAAVFCVLLFCDVSLCTWSSIRRACFGGRHSRRRFGGKA